MHRQRIIVGDAGLIMLIKSEEVERLLGGCVCAVGFGLYIRW